MFRTHVLSLKVTSMCFLVGTWLTQIEPHKRPCYEPSIPLQKTPLIPASEHSLKAGHWTKGTIKPPGFILGTWPKLTLPLYAPFSLSKFSRITFCADKVHAPLLTPWHKNEFCKTLTSDKFQKEVSCHLRWNHDRPKRSKWWAKKL